MNRVARAISPVTRLFTQGWRLSALVISLAVLTPVMVIFWSLFSPDLAVWQHLKEHLLWELTANTFWLVLGTASGTLVLGVALAWQIGRASCRERV